MNIILPANHTIIKADVNQNPSADIALLVAKSPAGRIQDPDQVKTAVPFSLPKTKYSQNVSVMAAANNSTLVVYHVVRYIPQSNKLTMSSDKP